MNITKQFIKSLKEAKLIITQVVSAALNSLKMLHLVFQYD